MVKLMNTAGETTEFYETTSPDHVRKYAIAQMAWYERKAKGAKAFHWWLKGIEVVAAAAIPVLALSPMYDARLITAALGAFVTVLEAFQQIYRFRDTWLNYRSTAEAIRRDLLLYGSGGGPFGDAPDRNRLLAERIAAVTAQENTRWIAYIDKTAGEKKEEKGKEERPAVVTSVPLPPT
ncbi:MAG TPA: DUF4231 domain-containing protein [Longimicrobium sp.]|nr:DUF4231 domain-containing protein [Longimicrobium sp.]